MNKIQKYLHNKDRYMLKGLDAASQRHFALARWYFRMSDYYNNKAIQLRQATK